jgi:hypothetical protein
LVSFRAVPPASNKVHGAIRPSIDAKPPGCNLCEL